MPEYLPLDRVQMEKAIVDKIVTLFETVVDIGNVWGRQRFPESDTEDLTVSTKPDPVTTRIQRTYIIEVGVPIFAEKAYTSEQSTQIEFTYPISFDLEVVDKWEKDGYEFTNSRDKAMAIALRCGKKLKDSIDLGFFNCVHRYLQQTQAGTTKDDKTGGRFHEADWSLTVIITDFKG